MVKVAGEELVEIHRLRLFAPRGRQKTGGSGWLACQMLNGGDD